MAQQLFQLVGASASECDTIPGRQCMASCFYLLRNFEDVNVYLNSIKAYLSHDDDFNWNYGLALAATGDYKAAEVRACLLACLCACVRGDCQRGLSCSAEAEADLPLFSFTKPIA